MLNEKQRAIVEINLQAFTKITLEKENYAYLAGALDAILLSVLNQSSPKMVKSVLTRLNRQIVTMVQK